MNVFLYLLLSFFSVVINLSLWDSFSIYNISADLFLPIGINLLIFNKRFESILFILSSIFFLTLLNGPLNWQVLIILCAFFSFYLILNQFKILTIPLIFLIAFLIIIFWNLIFFLLNHQNLSLMLIVNILGSAIYTLSLTLLFYLLIKFFKKNEEK